MMDLGVAIESVTVIESVLLRKRHVNSDLAMNLTLKMVVQTQIQKLKMREEY